MKPKRVALYVRVSTGEQNADLQVNELSEYAAFRKWDTVETYSDKMSGAKDQRPALDRLMADAKRGKFDVVAVWRFDRFARSTSHLLRALEEFSALGVDFVSLRESIDTSTPTGKMTFTVLAAAERGIVEEAHQPLGIDARAFADERGRLLVLPVGILVARHRSEERRV